MSNMATCVGADESDIWLAKKNHAIHRDFEDDLIIAAVQRADADYLVTSDIELIKHAPVATLSPQDMLAYMTSMDE